jgi:uncharacterized protein YecT (DUF1311 family)
MKAVIAVLFLLAAQVSLFSQEETCEGTTYDVSMCFLRILKKVEMDLNATYQRALVNTRRDYTARDVQALKIAERRWIEYRDAACTAEYGLWGGGSGGPAAHSGCLIKMAKERIGDLEALYLDRSK